MSYVQLYFGAAGTPGTDGVNPGDGGTAGGLGGPIGIQNTDPSQGIRVVGGAGGAGGSGAAGGSAGAGGNGGYAGATTTIALDSVYGTFGYAAAVGGAGGDSGQYSFPGHGANGGAGGFASANVSGANALGLADARAYATGGAGGAGQGVGFSGGSGGTASATAYAKGISATAAVTQVGGAGGTGFSGGAGADSTVVNAVGGQADYLRLLQTATGGAGGKSYGGAAGHGGAAKSQLVFSQTAAGSIYAKSTARGGAGGDGVYGAAGGTADAQAAVSGTGGVDVVASATGGSGGAANYGAGDGGAGGAAKGAQIFAVTTSGTTIANAYETGGRGGSGYGTGHSGGAGGAAYGSYAFASGDSAQAEVSQTGGMGGLGLEGADGGAGGDSTLSNRVAGRSRGGYLRLIQTATGGTGGDSLGGSAGRGGTAISGSVLNDTANPVAASLLYGKSTAFGGGGGDSSFRLASGGAGGGAAAGVALKGAHTVDARAYAYGGAGGRGLVLGEFGGAGGAASGSAAYASGYSANASVWQTGGAGGGGYSGGGAGADSTLTNAVSGRTSGGYLTLSQTATGGAGGYSRAGTAGAGGNAYSTLAFDDTANPVAAVVFTGNSTAHGGAGGTGKYGGSGGGGGAFARVVIAGTGETSAHALATGGAGGEAGHEGASGGAGGEAKGAQALMAVATGLGVARADETGGTGGKGYGVGYAGGAGGAATGSLAFAAGYSASVGLVQTGGDGGSGAAGADGGAGGDSAVVGRTGGIISVGTHANPPAEGVSGQTYGGFLDLSQTATGGAGGYSSTGAGGRGGEALSSFSFDDTKNAVAASSIYGRNKAVGGAGGNTASGSETGGAGGAASGLVSVKGSHAVTAYNYVTGGAGGNGGIGGNGGAATGSHAAAISTATSGRTYARAIETGGMGGTGFGPGNRAGAHGGAGGAASGSSAFAAGFNADAAVQQTGGAGGVGLNGASGGAGGSSTLADVVGGQTDGGYLELRQTATGGAGGDSHGANGGRGGLATSSLTFDDTTNLVASSFINGVSAAYGGKGGTSIADSSNSIGNGGIGGLAQSTIDLTGTNIVKTYADAGGGAGGRGYGVGHSGGAGGTASASHSFASGHSVRAAAYQRGGDGGGGTGGANGGAGAASTLADAVSGQTTGGYLKLNQVAVGGAGGYSVDGTAGAGGAASSTFSFDDRSAPITASSLYGRGIARGGAGGDGSYGGAGGGTAYASVDVTGAHSVKALAGAYGKAGGKASLSGIGGAGGAASAYARAETTGSDATALANVTGGAGGDGSSGGAGGAATGATAKARESSLSAGTQAYAKSVETAGAGGRGSGAGQSGGSGGTATGSSAFATGLSAQALVYQTGGAGGFGSDGASGGAGGNSTLANAAIGYVFGGYIHLVQVASGGRGGDDDGGLAGKGGSASSALVYLPASPNFVASKVTGRSAAKGGGGGGADLQAASLGPVTGGAGGGASATIDVTGANLVSADANSTGGAGGFGYGSGQSGGAGGAATVTSARGSGQSAIVSAEQTGGAGGWGLFGAAGGAGADSTLNNAVSGRTTGGYLELSQTAVGGAGGTSYGAAGGAGGSANSSFIFDDTTANPVQPSSLYGKSVAIGGAGGNGYTVAGTGGAASAKINLTGANSVSAVGYARGGQGGSADAGGGAAGGDAYAGAGAYATSPGATGTATAQATAFGGAGSLAGIANAIAAAATSNGQQAQATSVARGRHGDADAIAKTDGSGVVGSVRAEADAEVGSTDTSIALSLADTGSAYGFDDGTHNAYDFATELPSASYIASALQSHGDVGSVLGAMGASVFGAATQGYASDLNGARDYLSNTTWTLDTSTLTGDLVLGLLDTQTLGSGFDSLELDVFVGESLGQPSLAFHTSLTSLAAAQAFFTNHALDLGGFTSAPDLAVTVILDLVTSSQGSGFGVDYLLGVAPGNAPPVTTVPGSQLVQQGAATAISGISVADTDADSVGETITVVLSDTTGILSATGTGVSGPGTTLTISGSLAQVNADLSNVTLLEGTSGSDTIDIATSDGRGGSDDHQIAIDTNAPPVLHLSSTQLLAQQGVLAPISMFINDADASGETFTLSLSDTIGLLSVTGSGGVIVSGSGSTQLTIVGGRGPINNILASLEFEDGTYGSDTIDVALSDGRGGSDAGQIAVAINAPPVTTVPGSQLVQQGAATPISGISVADTDADSVGETITVVLSDTTGILSATGTGVSGPGTTLTISGSLAQVNADLSNVTLLEGTSGSDTIDIATSDGRGGSDDHQIAVKTNAVPVAVDDSYVVAPGSRLDTDQVGVSGVLANDSDTDGDPLSAQLQTDPSHGSLIFRTDGSFVYTPAPGFDGTDSFTYLVKDGVFDSNLATVTLHVNASPVAKPDFYLLAPGQSLNIPSDEAAISGVLVNDFDAEGDPLTASLAPGGDPTHGTLSLNPDGSFTYTPNAGFHGADSFTYLANDGFSNSAPATVTLAVDTPPVAVNDIYVMLVPSQEIDIGLDVEGNGTPGVLANDTDADGDTLSAHPLLDPFDSPKHGHVTLSADGSFAYTPNPGYAGPDTFSYFASDGLASSNIATVSLRVAPVARSDFYLLAPGQSLNIPSDEAAISGVLVNDSDAQGDPLTASLAPGGGPANGTLSLNPDGSFSYTPNVGFHGADSFTYVANDGLSDSNIATVTLAVDTPPVAVDDTYVMLVPGQEIDIGLDAAGNGTPGVLANDTDADGDTLSAHPLLDPFDSPKHGHVTLSADGSFVYTPNLGYAGPDTFSYFASDGLASSNIATVSLRVAPVARSDFYLLAPGQSLNIPSDEAAISGVLVNDSDAQGDPLTASLAPGGGPANGTLSLNPDGSFSYTPNVGFHGADSFTYVANDELSDSNIATVTLAVDTPPVAVDDTYVMLVPGQEIDIGLDAAGNGTPGVLANDTDADSDTLSAHLLLDPFDSPKHGRVTLSADGSFVYLPDPGYAGPDSFAYIASDGFANSNIATVTLRVPPVAVVVSTPVSPIEGNAFSGQVATFTASNPNDTADSFMAMVDWGDGTVEAGTVTVGNGNFAVSVPGSSHSYADEGDYTATVTVTRRADGNTGAGFGTITVAEGDVLTPSPVTLLADPDKTLSGTVAIFSDTVASPPSDFTATIEWGDGTTSAGVVSVVNGTFTVSGTHAYTATGVDFIGVTLTDDAPGTATATSFATAYVGAVIAVAIGPLPVAPIEGSLFNGQVASFSSSNRFDTAASYAGMIDWGDGTTSPGMIGELEPGAFFVSSFGHVYFDEGAYTAAVTVTRTADGTSNTGSGKITVLDADALLASPVQPVNANAGQTFNAVATFTDFPSSQSSQASPASDFTATIDWGDGTTTAGVVSAGGGGFGSGQPETLTVSGTHAYAIADKHIFTVTLSDDAPGAATATSSGTVYVGAVLGITVDPVGGGAPPPVEHSLFSGQVATFNSSNLLDTADSYSAVIDWGDGTSAGTISGGNGQFTVSGDHFYFDDGFYPMKVTVVRTADGRATTGSSQITVGDDDVLTPAPPLLLSANPRFAGTVATFADTDRASPPSDFVASIDWGDGTTTVGDVQGGGGTLAVLGSHTYAATGRDKVTVTLSDDAGGNKAGVSTTTMIVETLSVVLNGTAREGAMLIATPTLSGNSSGSVADITYQWMRDGSAIGGATGSAYQLTEADELAHITVQASFTDAGTGQTLNATSNPSGLVIDPPPTLSVRILGTAQENQTLQAIAVASSGDAVITYQWQQLNGTSWVNIAHATGPTYQVVESNENHQLRVLARSSDPDSGNASATSPSTALVIDVTPTISVTISGTAQEGQLLSATAIVTSDGDGGHTTYQWQERIASSWVAISGATSANFRATEPVEGLELRVMATFTDDTGQSVSATSDATAPVVDPTPALSLTVTGIAQEGRTLTAHPHITSDADGGTTTYQWQRLIGSTWTDIVGAQASTYQVTEPDEGFELRATAVFTDDTRQTAAAASAATASVIDIAPTLSVSISGTALEGDTLEATATANDADASISFQWQQLIGGTWTDIAGATASSYLIDETNEGRRLRVSAKSADPDGGGITVNSAATAPVTDPPPTLTVASSSLFVAAGGSVALPISVTGFDADDRVSVTIDGLPAFETITDALDPRTFAGASVSLTAAEVNSGLTLHSRYTGNGQPVNVLTVTATTTTAGESSKSAAQSIVVTDPPANRAANIDGSLDNASLSGVRADPGLQLNTESTGTAGPSGGNLTISGSTELELFGASTANAAFAPGDTAILWHDASYRFNGVVAGLAPGNSLDLADIAFGRDTTLVYTPDGDNTAGTLSASDGNHNANIALLGQYMASSFVMASDGHGGTLITDPPSSQTQILSQSHR